MREPRIVLSPFPHHFRHIQKRKVKPQIGNSMAMQPPPLMSCPETTSCFSENIITSTTLKGSMNQSEVKLFLERCSLILTYDNSVLCNIMSNMEKYSFTASHKMQAENEAVICSQTLCVLMCF